MAIIILLWTIATTLNTNLKTKTLNGRTLADLETLENSFETYLQENNSLPTPQWNTNWFKADTSYTEKNDSQAYWVYGQVTSKTLPNKYLNFLPLDQFTGAFYSYGKTINELEFEIAGIVREDGEPKSLVLGNYKAEQWPFNLIREYNWPNFVYDGSAEYFPYNPTELSLNARIHELSFWAYEVGQVFEENDQISIPANETMTLYFADGSKAVLGSSEATRVVLAAMDYLDDDSLKTQINLLLTAWTIWLNATQMSEGSSLSVQSWDTTAAVRWTIFWMDSNGNVEVVSWTVAVTRNGQAPVNINSSHGENGTVESLDERIKYGYGELSNTIFTRVVSHDHVNQELELEISDTIKYDADYLKLYDNDDFKLKYSMPMIGDKIVEIRRFLICRVWTICQWV